MNYKYKYDENKLREKAKQSYNMSNLLTLYGIIPAGGNYTVMHRQLKHFNIDISHWGSVKDRQGHLRGKHNTWVPTIPLKDILVKNSTYGGGTLKLKKRLIKAGLLEHKCYKCGLKSWLDKPIPTELEHINGIRTDNSIENLTILCPNCHSFTPTYRRKKVVLREGLEPPTNPL